MNEQSIRSGIKKFTLHAATVRNKAAEQLPELLDLLEYILEYRTKGDWYSNIHGSGRHSYTWPGFVPYGPIVGRGGGVVIRVTAVITSTPYSSISSITK